MAGAEKSTHTAEELLSQMNSLSATISNLTETLSTNKSCIPADQTKGLYTVQIQQQPNNIELQQQQEKRKSSKNSATPPKKQLKQSLIELNAEFSSFLEIQAALDLYQREKNIQLVVKDSKLLTAGSMKRVLPKVVHLVNPLLMYHSLTYACKYHTELKLQPRPGVRTRNVAAKHLSCPMYIRFKLSQDLQTLVLFDIVEQHNHPTNIIMFSQTPRQQAYRISRIKKGLPDPELIKFKIKQQSAQPDQDKQTLENSSVQSTNENTAASSNSRSIDEEGDQPPLKKKQRMSKSKTSKSKTSTKTKTTRDNNVNNIGLSNNSSTSNPKQASGVNGSKETNNYYNNVNDDNNDNYSSLNTDDSDRKNNNDNDNNHNSDSTLDSDSSSADNSDADDSDVEELRSNLKGLPLPLPLRLIASAVQSSPEILAITKQLMLDHRKVVLIKQKNLLLTTRKLELENEKLLLEVQALEKSLIPSSQQFESEGVSVSVEDQQEQTTTVYVHG